MWLWYSLSWVYVGFEKHVLEAIDDKKASTRSLAPNLNSLYLFCLDRITVMARLLRRRVTYLRKLLSWLLPYKMMSCVCLSGRVDTGHVWTSDFEQLLSRKYYIYLNITHIMFLCYTQFSKHSKYNQWKYFVIITITPFWSLHVL